MSGSNPEVTDITDAYTDECDNFLIDNSVSFSQEPAVDHPTSRRETESVDTIVETDFNAVANKEFDNSLPHVGQEYHNNNNNNTEETQQATPIPEPARITVANPRPDGRFYCYFEDCTKSYAKKGGLDVHIKGRHSPNGRQKCRFSPCTKTFAQPADCKRHENVTHKGHMYVCDNCKVCSTRKPSVKKLNAMASCRSPGPGGLHNFLLLRP